MLGKTNICAMEGTIPSGTIQITENGTVDVAQYANADVQVESLLKYATSIQYLFANATEVPDILELDYQNVGKFTYGGSQYCQPKELIMHLSDKCTEMLGACRWGNILGSSDNRRQLVKIKITGDLSNVTTYQYCFSSTFWSDNGRQPNATIDADLNFTSATNVSNMFAQCWQLVNVRFVPNTLKISLNMGVSHLLSTASLVSIINGLNETATGKTLTLHATPKATLSTIMGTVSLDETETYHIFTADPNGNTTLLDFATQTKGWTIA